jgi:hypothetical protein
MFCLINPIVATLLKKLYQFKVSIHPLNKKQLNYIGCWPEIKKICVQLELRNLA